MCDSFPRKLDVQTSYKLCCEHKISSCNLSHDSVFDTRTLLFKYPMSRKRAKKNSFNRKVPFGKFKKGQVSRYKKQIFHSVTISSLKFIANSACSR